MDRKLIWLGICFVAFAGSAAAQTNVTNNNDGASGTVPAYSGSATLTNSPISVSGGSVGIGTATPTTLLNLYGSAPNLRIQGLTAGDHADILNTSSTQLLLSKYSPTGQALIDFNPVPADATSEAMVRLFRSTNTTGSVMFQVMEGNNTSNSNVLLSGNGNSFLNALAGNVGIGTTSPGAKLEVDGNVKLTAGSGASITFQDGTVQSTAYTGVLPGGDYADSVDVNGDRAKYGPGDLLVIDPDHPGKFLKSGKPYSTSVAGIFSTKPGTLGRRQTGPKSPDEVPMAMVGIVPTKVSAENGPIHPGDLLVTASTAGYAMKGTDRTLMLGAVVGKALGKLDSGTGVIEVVVTLQ